MFGHLVAAHRRRLSLTQEELARRTGLSERTIRSLEAGQGRVPRPASVRLLADAFGLDGAERDAFIAGARPQGPPGSDVAVTRPAQLPADVRGFAGRRAALEFLDRLLPAPDAPPDAMPVAAVSGTAGVGKTTLVVHWAHRVRGRFPDGQLYVDLRGYDMSGRMVPASAALSGFLVALGVPRRQIPAHVPEQAAMFRTLTDGKRLLLILDNARDTEQVRALLPGTPTTVVVVTSRDRLTTLVASVGADPLHLDVFTAREAHDLLRGRLGDERVQAEPHAAAQIVTACGGLPLALTLTAARALQTTFPIATIAAELAETSDRLGVLDDGNDGSGPSTVFSWSYDTLSPAAGSLFRLLGLHPGPDISIPAAASLAGRPVGEARRHLRELHRASLITEPSRGRFAFHDLVRAFAHNLAMRTDSEDTRHASVTRLLDHYLHTSCRAQHTLHVPHHHAGAEPALPGVVHTALHGSGEATAWFAAEGQNLLACISHAATRGFDRHACHLALDIAEFLDAQARWHDMLRVAELALSCAKRLGDRHLQGHVYRKIARAHSRFGRPTDAADQLHRALAIFEAIDDPRGRCVAHWNLAGVRSEQGRRAEAHREVARALRLAKELGDPALYAGALNTAGWICSIFDELDRALRHLLPSLDLCRRYHLHDQVHALDSLAHTYLKLGRHTEATACFTEALALFQSAGNDRGTGRTLLGLGDAYAAAGRHADARDAWERALAIYRTIGHPDAPVAAARLAEA